MTVIVRATIVTSNDDWFLWGTPDGSCAHTAVTANRTSVKQIWHFFIFRLHLLRDTMRSPRKFAT
jgi:hypothetical protein